MGMQHSKQGALQQPDAKSQTDLKDLQQLRSDAVKLLTEANMNLRNVNAQIQKSMQAYQSGSADLWGAHSAQMHGAQMGMASLQSLPTDVAASHIGYQSGGNPLNVSIGG